ncbi:MAG: DUF1294 domain-containing protein [Bacillota bacterium]
MLDIRNWLGNVQPLYLVIISVFFIVNIVGFIICGVDKYKARRGLWRIPEKAFFWIAAIGGAPGTYSGLLFFRHKTKHWYFMLGIPLIFIIQIIILFLFITQVLPRV